MVIGNLKKHRCPSLFKKAALNVMVRQLPPKKVRLLRQEFEKYDKTGDGFIGADELKQALEAQGHEATSGEIERIFKNIDFAGNHKINYSEFLAATINVQEFLTEEKLNALFNTFDVDQSG